MGGSAPGEGRAQRRGGVDRETKESHKAICSLCYTSIQVLGDRVLGMRSVKNECSFVASLRKGCW